MADTVTSDSFASGRVIGRLVDSEANPISGARVFIRWWSAQEREERELSAGDDGRFDVELPCTVYPPTLWAESPEYARLRCDDVRVYPDACNDLGDLRLGAGTRMSGRVVTTDRVPIAGAVIRVTPYYHQLGHTIAANGPPIRLTSADDGRFRTPPLPPGKAKFEFEAEGRATKQSWQEHILPDRETVELGDVRLTEADLISGIVVDGDGRGVAHATVEVRMVSRVSCKTDGDGRFCITSAGSWVSADAVDDNIISEGADPPVTRWGFHLTVRRDGYEPHRQYFDEKHKALTGMRITIQRAVEIRGEVRDVETDELVAFDELSFCTVQRDDQGEEAMRYG